jgi:hypothetical protein
MIRNKSMNGVRFAVLMTALGFSTLAVAAVQVDLELDGSRLVVTSNSAQCSGGPIDCIDVKHGTNPHLFFNLRGACGNSGPDYQLAAFRIGMQNKVWPTPAKPLPDHVAQDFNANPQTGYVNLSHGDNQLRPDKIKLKDYNKTAYTVYYDVTVSHCTNMTADDIHLDPQIRNGGNR